MKSSNFNLWHFSCARSHAKRQILEKGDFCSASWKPMFVCFIFYFVRVIKILQRFPIITGCTPQRLCVTCQMFSCFWNFVPWLHCFSAMIYWILNSEFCSSCEMKDFIALIISAGNSSIRLFKRLVFCHYQPSCLGKLPLGRDAKNLAHIQKNLKVRGSFQHEMLRVSLAL